MWVDAFDEFMGTCEDSIKFVIDNVQALHECRDAKDVEDRRRRDAHRDGAQSGWSKRNETEQFAGDIVEDDLLNHIDSVINYASNRHSRMDADVLECLNELGELRIFSAAVDQQR